MIQNPTDPKFTFDVDVYSDIYKDTYGVRPHYDRFYGADTTDEERQEIWDRLIVAHEEAMGNYERAEQEAIRNFEQTIQLAIDAGANDRDTAIRWLKDSFNDEDVKLDEDYFKFCMGLPGYYSL